MGTNQSDILAREIWNQVRFLHPQRPDIQEGVDWSRGIDSSQEESSQRGSLLYGDWSTLNDELEQAFLQRQRDEELRVFLSQPPIGEPTYEGILQFIQPTTEDHNTMALQDWAAQQRRQHRPERRFASFWKGDTQEFCWSTPYWPRFVTLVKQYEGKWNGIDKVWRIPAAQFTALLVRINTDNLNHVQFYRAHVPVPCNVHLDELSLFSRDGDNFRPGTSEASRSLWGVPSRLHNEEDFDLKLHGGVTIAPSEFASRFFIQDGQEAGFHKVPLFLNGEEPDNVRHFWRGLEHLIDLDGSGGVVHELDSVVLTQTVAPPRLEAKKVGTGLVRRVK